MNVGIDVSPLRQTRAGTARYLLGLLSQLERLVVVQRLAWGGAGRAATVARDAVWYPLALPFRARKLDVARVGDRRLASSQRQLGNRGLR